ncbi:hypothetical protein JAAARDRAFT_198388 [Jaapia argillacea MUCL 33604]|uniref:Protein kinase domain-containing protein n=1 Tax=Jaapia argillacea MUCL 33604 TaxID=933084 RepID=A0A067PPF5_9AGAM|nr:hypothetical protein JAAARDRAFT_198388 [Jaapia argillacea MUCL 33604]
MGTRNKPPYTLTRNYLRKPPPDRDSESSTTEPTVVTKATLIHGNSDVRVYRAKMHDCQGRIHDIVAKIALGDGDHILLKEGKFYENQLSGLQGDAVPRCFGLFEGELGLEAITVLLLEDCGTAMMVPFYNAEIMMALKRKIVEKLDKIHQAGVAHLDISPSNVVIKDGEPFWIDFEHAVRHICPRRRPITPGEFNPGVGEFSCAEMYELVGSLGFWKSTRVNFHGRGLMLQAVDSPQALYDSLHPSRVATQEQREQVWHDAIETYNAVAGDRKLYLRQLKREDQQLSSSENDV